MNKVLILIFISAVFLFGCAKNKIVLPDGSSIKIELAKTQEETERGLMFRKELGDKEGMLFIFPEDNIRLFWMKNTLIDLDMIFIDGTGKITSISRQVPHSYVGAPEEEIAQAAGFGKYVLEVNSGFADKHNLHPGDKLIIGIK